MTISANKHLPEIDGLRALAVVAVVLYHANVPGFGSGFLGVDVFFVISGYLITGLLFAEAEHSGRIDYLAFYARRFRRLLPAMALMVMAAVLAAWVVLFPAELPRLAKSATAVVLMFSNLHFMKYSGGYFDPSVDVMPLLHTWSLSVEEQFYLCWPVLMGLSVFVARRSGSSPRRLLGIVLGSAACLSFAYWSSNFTHSPNVAFYAMPARIWELALGGLLNFLPVLSLRKRRRAVGQHLSTLAIATLLATLCVPLDGETVAMLRYPVAVGASALLIWGIHQHNTSPLVQILLKNRIAIFLGLISYSLYLWHWPLLALTRAYHLGERMLERDLLVVGIALILSILSYHFVETPIRRKHPWPFSTDWNAVRAAIAIVVCVSAVAHLAKEWGKERDAALNREILGITASASQHCEEPPDTRSLLPRESCTGGAHDGPLRLLAWGDSHAGHLEGMLEPLSERHGTRYLKRALGSCPPLHGATPIKGGVIQTVCHDHNQLVLAEIRQLAKEGLKAVILGGRWNSYLSLPETKPSAITSYALIDDRADPNGNLRVGSPPLDRDGSLKTLESSLRATLQELSDMNLKVIVVGPVPEPYFNAPHCLYRKSEAECRFPRKRVDERRNPTLEALKQATAGLPNVRLIDPIAYFCDEQYCRVREQQFSIYVDTDHITHDMAGHLANQLDPELEWLWHD